MEGTGTERAASKGIAGEAHSKPKSPQTDGTFRISIGPKILVQANGNRFHSETGARNFLSMGLICGTSVARMS